MSEENGKKKTKVIYFNSKGTECGSLRMLTHGGREATAESLRGIQRLEVAHAQVATDWQAATTETLLLFGLGAQLAITRLNALLFHGEWTIDLEK